MPNAPAPVHGPMTPQPVRCGSHPLVTLLAAVVLAAVLAGCNGLFFQPNRVRYYLPQQFSLQWEDVFFESGDGTRLTGWFLPAQGESRGTVVFFHGNAANISNHLPVVRWLPPAGYAVFIFDYRGFGVSEGEPTRAGLVQDGAAAIRWVRRRPDADRGRIVVFGQSLGGAVAVNALAEAGTEGVGALVLEGAFASYRDVARSILNANWFTWPFQYPATWLAISDELSPYEALPAIAAVPLLVLHSPADRTVPVANGLALYEAFPGPDKTFWSVDGVRHIGSFTSDDSPWRQRLLDYLEGRLERSRADR